MPHVCVKLSEDAQAGAEQTGYGSKFKLPCEGRQDIVFPLLARGRRVVLGAPCLQWGEAEVYTIATVLQKVGFSTLFINCDMISFSPYCLTIRIFFSVFSV